MVDMVGDRLPTFDQQWVDIIKGSWDFLGLNHYTTELVYPDPDAQGEGWYVDQKSKTYQDPAWPNAASSWLKTVPWGLRKLLVWIKDTYGNPEVIVTENGFSDFEHVKLNDTGRVYYYTNYINQMLRAVNEDGCHVTGYFAWSLLDNFEWALGYT